MRSERRGEEAGGRVERGRQGGRRWRWDGKGTGRRECFINIQEEHEWREK